MTYREKIQTMVDNLQHMYDEANLLREHATQEEKCYWNEFRGKTMAAWTPLQNLDNKLTQDRANEQL